MATAPEINSNNGAFFPAVDQWRTVDVDLSEYVGETILVQFFFTSAWGDMMYIDNINAIGVSSLNSLAIEESLDVFPNPVKDVINVSVETLESSAISYTLFNSIGQVVSIGKVSDNHNGVNTYQIPTNNLEAGMYNLYFQLGDKEVVKRIIIE